MTELWKVGDWCVFETRIGQITQLDEDGSGARFSDGSFETSGGDLIPRVRALTLRNKRIIEWFDYYYRELKKIDGHNGFNYPDISNYFYSLALDAIDNMDSAKEIYDKAQEFVREARKYMPYIQGVRLFSRAA